MLTFNHRIAREFDRLITERQDYETGILVNGNATDMPHYSRVVGRIEAFRDAREFLAEAIATCEAN